MFSSKLFYFKRFCLVELFGVWPKSFAPLAGLPGFPRCRVTLIMCCIMSFCFLHSLITTKVVWGELKSKKPSWQDDDDKKRRVVVGGGGRKKYFFWTKKFADFFDSLFREKTFLDVTSKCSRSISLGNQCDQMSILNNEICPMAYKICQSRLKILPRTCNILPKCRNLAKSGHTVGTICPWSKIIFKCEYFLASFLFFSILLNR